MDSYPVIRRRPRPLRVSSDKEAVHVFEPRPLLVIVTDDPEFMVPQLPVKAKVRRWSAANRGRAPGEFSGDPTALETYAWLRALPNVYAAIVLHDHERASFAAAAIQAVNPDAAVLVVDAANEGNACAQLLCRLDAQRALQLRMEEELRRLATRRRVRALREFAEDAAVLPILVHQDPDPDALASAQAVRVLLRRNAQNAPIITLDEMTRPENRRMAELLDIHVTQVTEAELLAFDRILCIDTQPRGALHDRHERVAVIDHHPPEVGRRRQFQDIRPHYGATATIVTEYLRAEDERWINAWIATGLVYAIKTDTDNLSRGVSPADVAAYTFLLGRVDDALLRRIERPALSEETARAYGRALAELAARNDLVLAWLGPIVVNQSHILADAADFCLAIEQATWSAAAAIVEGRIVVTLRHMGGEPGAGALARALAEANGPGAAGGGHASMARAVLLPRNEWGALLDAPPDAARELALGLVLAELDRLRG